MGKKQTQGALTVEIERQEWYMTLEGEPVLHCILTGPECAGEWRGLAAINRSYRHAAQAVRAYWERELYLRACLELADCRSRGRRFYPWRAEVDTRITYVGDGLLSLWQEERERRGGAPELDLVRRGDTWSLRDGAPRPLSSFIPGRRWKRQVLRQVTQLARQRLDGGESLLDADCAQRLRREFCADRFYLTEEGAEVFYPMCTVAAAGEGIPAFPIRLTPEKD